MARVVDRLPLIPLKIRKRQGSREVELVVDGLRNRPIVRKLANLDVAESNLVSVILQTNVSLARFAKPFKLREFAGRNLVVPIVVTKFEVVIANTVDANLAVILVDANVKLIPLTGGTCRIGDRFVDGPTRNRGLIELVEPARLLGIVTVDVVLNLDFGTRVPWGPVSFKHVEHDATVPLLADLVFQRELKVVVLLVGDDIASTFSNARDRTIDHFPTIGDSVLLVVSPAVGGLAVKEQLPSAALFGFSQLVGGRICQGKGGERKG